MFEALAFVIVISIVALPIVIMAKVYEHKHTTK